MYKEKVLRGIPRRTIECHPDTVTFRHLRIDLILPADDVATQCQTRVRYHITQHGKLSY